ncbi:uncharacterized protein LOC124912494 isoform X2 [Impatiens glandulifera]|uniref:uncharacterized protein LOC124912494 isoform X2 n=1 Tax=Impatiens glandulifera TaxID=253017 RepID=UPI001FB088B0|nr:uncharacterized protein LOC124912494 isoform X2 [Impatiens glandulifera]
MMEDEPESEGLAIKALGSLFKITEVFLWDDDDDSFETSEGLRSKEQTNFLDDEDVVNHHARLKTFSITAEDAELSMLMNELGLPHSFQTNKAKKKRKEKVKMKDPNLVILDIHETIANGTANPTKVSETETASTTVLHDISSTVSSLCSMSKLDSSEQYSSDIAVGAHKTECLIDQEEQLADNSSSIKNEDSMETSAQIDKIDDGFLDQRFVIAENIDHFLKEENGGLLEFACTPIDQEEQLADNSSSIENEDSMKTAAQIDKIDDGFLDQRLVIAENIDHFLKEENGGLLEFACTPIDQDEVNSSSIKNEDSIENSAQIDKIDDGFLDQRLVIAENIDHFLKEENGGLLEFACTEGDMVNDGDLNSTEANLATYPHSLEVMDLVGTDDKGYNASGDWTSHWDTFYMRNYFYNIRTNESTWEPPEGMEHLAFSEADKLVELDIESASQDVVPDTSHLVQSADGCDVKHIVNSSLALFDDSLNANLQIEVMDSSTDVADVEDNSATEKIRKKAVKRTRLRKSIHEKEIQVKGILEEFSLTIAKYWWQRYILFSKFDEGIKMDEEGWFSVTPESIARHQATRCCTGIVVDCFAGMGGNAIQFAMSSNHVIAIDIDPNKIVCAIHNAGIYGVDDRIDFIEGDSFVLGQRLKADTVYLSPPWGGPDYLKAKRYDLQTMLRPLDGRALFDFAKKIAPKVVMFLPRNVDYNQLADLALSSVPPWSLEVERNFLNGKLKAITAYFSDPSRKRIDIY